MFVYEITTTDGFVTRVTTAGDPTEHPAFYGRVLNVETLGELALRIVQQCQTPMLDFDQTKGNTMSLSDHWNSVYTMLPENTFDYVGKPFFVEPSVIQMWDGSQMVSYVEVPF